MDIQTKREHVKNTLYQLNTVTRIMIPITALIVVIGIITINVVHPILTIAMFAIATILFIMCANVSYKIFLIFDNIHDDEVVERVYDIVCK